MKAKYTHLIATLKILFCLLLLLPSIPSSAVIRKEIRINVPSRTLQFLQSGRLIREYPVGVGYSKQMQTPAGEYKVEKKVINPIWEHPYKAPGQSQIGNNSKNPLGSRWIGFHSQGSGVYGIHGTNEPSSIGKFVSHGCVRMKNSDVEELFELVDYDTPVIVTYNRFRLDKTGETITLEIFPDPYGMKPLTIEEIVEEVRKIDPYAVIDFDMVNQAIGDNSESSIYEVAQIKNIYQRSLPVRTQVPFTEPYNGQVYGQNYNQSGQPSYAYPPFSRLPQAPSYSYPPTAYPTPPVYY